MNESLNRYYIAGPMSGIEGHNFKEFDKYAKGLRNVGYDIVSPAEIARSLPGEPGDLPYHTYVREDIKAMLDCTDIIMLPGWRGSRGAKRELDLADFLQFRVWSVEPNFTLVRMSYGDVSV